MRVARVGSIRWAFMLGLAVALAAPAAAPGAPAAGPRAAPATTRATATAPPTTPSFKIAISPEYTTAGQQTTFEVTVGNTSSPGTTVGSVKLTSPAGFSAPVAAPGTALRGKTQVRGRTLSLHRVAIRPDHTAHLSITATAPTKCGRTLLHWSAQAFQSTDGSGSRLALGAALSSLGVRVLCPAAAACGDGGPACSTSLVTSNSTYAVVSDAASGTLNQTVNVGNRLRCGTYRFRDVNWYDSVVTPPATGPPTAAPAPIVDTVTYTIRNATKKGIGFCLGAGYEFTTRSGAPAPARTLPTGKPGFAGLLPLCTSSKPPCIAGISQQRDAKAKSGFDALMKIEIPESGDPWGRS